jgi:hypothetical protein
VAKPTAGRGLLRAGRDELRPPAPDDLVLDQWVLQNDRHSLQVIEQRFSIRPTRV